MSYWAEDLPVGVEDWSGNGLAGGAVWAEAMVAGTSFESYDTVVIGLYAGPVGVAACGVAWTGGGVAEVWYE